MGFYGLIVKPERQSVDVPAGFSLQLLMACLDLDVSKGASTTLWLQPGGSSSKFIMCHLGPQAGLNFAIQQEFCCEDGPITLWCSPGTAVHITGRWTVAEEDDHDHDEDEEEEEEEEEEAVEEKKAATADAAAAPKQEEKSAGNKRQRTASAAPAPAPAAAAEPSAAQAQATATKAAAQKQAQTQAQAKKKAKASEDAELLALASMMAPAHVEPPSAAAEPALNKRKKWKVKPENDEGVLVPEPKQLTHKSGVLFTDFVVGKGIEPKLGCKIKILYEGSFPDGTVFDSRLKRSKPFVFRKGATEVIRGLDLGVEGMRVGGSREIVVPPALG